MNVSSHRSDLQALRGVAVMLVVLYHAEVGFTGGFVGVDAFFVVSGFVIARGLLREVDRTGTVDLRQFYVRRVRRLLPALATLIVPVLAVSIVFVPLTMQQQLARTALSASVFLSNVYLYVTGGDYFGTGGASNPFVHLWSLSLEEQFYMVLPVSLLVLVRLGRRVQPRHPRWLLVGTFGTVSLVSLWLSWQFTSGQGAVAATVGSPVEFAFYAPITRVWEFLVGVLLAAAVTERSLPRPVQVVVRSAGLVALVASAWMFDTDTQFPGVTALVPVLGTAAMIAAGPTVPRSHRADAPCRVVAVVVSPVGRLMRALGDVSYSWYLWHWPAIVVARSVWPTAAWTLPIAAAASLVPAVAAMRLVENPVRFRAVELRRPTALVAAVCIAVPAAAAMATPRIVDALVGDDENPAVLPGNDPFVLADDCYAPRPTAIRTWQLDRCTLRQGDGERLVMLFGDSHAASASHGVAAAAARLGADMSLWARAACPLLVDRWPTDRDDCREWQVVGRQAIVDEQPDVVVIAHRSRGYTTGIGDKTPWAVAGPTDRPPSNDAEALQTWDEGFTGLLDDLTAQGIAVVVVSNAPDFSGQFAGFRPSLLRRHNPPPTDTVERVEQRRGGVVALERRIAARYPTVRTIDPADVLCDDTVCRSGTVDDWWYYDDNHLDRSGSLRLTDLLTEAIGDLLGDTPDGTP